MHGLDIIHSRNAAAAGREAAADYRDGDFRRANRIVSLIGAQEDARRRTRGECDYCVRGANAAGCTCGFAYGSGPQAPEAWAPFIVAYQDQREVDDAQYGKYDPARVVDTNTPYTGARVITRHARKHEWRAVSVGRGSQIRCIDCDERVGTDRPCQPRW